MVKNISLILVLLFTTFLFGASEYDKNIVVKNQTRNDKVKTVFREMMDAYEEEDIGQFFFYVSEDRFEQDYMTFYEAIDEDIRVYDILSIDTWVNKITDDGVKRYLYVQWDKRYLATSNDKEINQRGYSRFLFDEVNGKYKLIQLAGNNFWGKSLPEWTEEVPEIAGQELETTLDKLPDLTFENVNCSGSTSGTLTFDIVNLGGSTNSGSIEYVISENSTYNDPPHIYNGDISSGDRVTLSKMVDCGMYNNIVLDPNDLISESDKSNNCNGSGCP